MNEKEADAIAQIAMYCEKIKRAQESSSRQKTCSMRKRFTETAARFMCSRLANT